MSNNLITKVKSFDITSFIWQHLWLLLSLFTMTFGVALCVRSSLGSSVISTIPFVMTIAGEEHIIRQLTIGEWTFVMNFILVALQILILRRNFQPSQLLQLVIGFLFGWLLDINMLLTESFAISGLPRQIAAQFFGCTVLGVGIAFEIKCGSVTMPGEGLPAAISKISGQPFAKIKIYIDIALVTTAVTLGYIFLGKWMWQVVGTGTLFAMIYVGAVVKFIMPHISWFDNVLGYSRGIKRYLYGLAKYINRKQC